MSALIIPRAEDIIAARPGCSRDELKEMAREFYLNGTLDHIPMQWISTGIVEKWDPDQTAWAYKQAGISPRMTPVETMGYERRLERDDLYRIVGEPEIVEDPPSNLLINNGINRLLNLLIGTGSIAAYTNTVARLGTGNSSTAEAASQTDLQAAAGSSNRWFQVSAATYPQVSAQTLTEQATWATGDGNYAWNEWGIDGGGSSSSATVGTNTTTLCALLNRKVATLGTKASGSTWTLTVTIVIS